MSNGTPASRSGDRRGAASAEASAEHHPPPGIRGLERLESTVLASINLVALAGPLTGGYVPELREPFEKVDSCKKLDALLRS
jgi:hypothetical protein